MWCACLTVCVAYCCLIDGRRKLFGSWSSHADWLLAWLAWLAWLLWWRGSSLCKWVWHEVDWDLSRRGWSDQWEVRHGEEGGREGGPLIVGIINHHLTTNDKCQPDHSQTNWTDRITHAKTSMNISPLWYLLELYHVISHYSIISPLPRDQIMS